MRRGRALPRPGARPFSGRPGADVKAPAASRRWRREGRSKGQRGRSRLPATIQPNGCRPGGERSSATQSGDTWEEAFGDRNASIIWLKIMEYLPDIQGNSSIV